MPAPAHGRLIFSGVFGTAALPFEQWSTSVAFDDPGPSILEADLEAIAEAANGTWFQIGSGLGTAVILTNVRAVAVADTGFTARDPFGKYLQADVPVNKPGNATGALDHPTQVSLALTLQTAYPGPLGRGRMYLPGPATGALDVDGTLSTTSHGTWATRAAGWLDALNTALEGARPGTRLSVASGGSVTKGVPGAIREVTTVRVGKRLDVQRRRAEDIEESYIDRPLA